MELSTTDLTDYKNFDQRNVHVWAPWRVRQKHCIIVAGCYTDGTLTYDRFYRWLDKIFQQPKEGQYFISKHVEDPRVRWPGSSFRSHHTHHITRQDTGSVEEGDYFILLKIDGVGGHTWSQNFPSMNNLYEQRSSLFCSLKATENHLTALQPKRTNFFREEVRRRDGGCIVTDTRAPSSDRGVNFTGFEAAHLWPWAWWVKLERNIVKEIMKEPARLKLKDRGTSPRTAGINSPENGILLSATLHLTMDALEWSIDYDRKAVRFERHSAVFLPKTLNPIHDPHPLPVTDGQSVPKNYDDDIRDAHFTVVLLHRVAGGGPGEIRTRA